MNAPTFMSTITSPQYRSLTKKELEKRKQLIERITSAMQELSEYGEFSITLTEEQLRQIDEARARGDKITITLDVQ